MKSKSIMWVNLLLLVVLVAACTETGSTGSGSRSTDYTVGTEGLTINFLNREVWREVISNTNIPVMVEYKNRGSHDLPAYDYEIHLIGYDNSIMRFGPRKGSKELLYGKSARFPDGSHEGVMTWEANPQLPQDVKEFNQDIRAVACYNYRTVASAEVCLDPQKNSYTEVPRCDFTVRNLGSSQGAPMAVTNVDLMTAPTGGQNKAYMRITVQNKGGGIPYSDLDPGSCHTTRLDHTKIDYIKPEVRVKSASSMNCYLTDNKLRLVNGQATFTCDFTFTGDDFQVSALTVILDYGYREDIGPETMSIVEV